MLFILAIIVLVGVSSWGVYHDAIMQRQLESPSATQMKQ